MAYNKKEKDELTDKYEEVNNSDLNISGVTIDDSVYTENEDETPTPSVTEQQDRLTDALKSGVNPEGSSVLTPKKETTKTPEEEEADARNRAAYDYLTSGYSALYNDAVERGDQEKIDVLSGTQPETYESFVAGLNDPVTLNRYNNQMKAIGDIYRKQMNDYYGQRNAQYAEAVVEYMDKIAPYLQFASAMGKIDAEDFGSLTEEEIQRVRENADTKRQLIDTETGKVSGLAYILSQKKDRGGKVTTTYMTEDGKIKSLVGDDSNKASGVERTIKANMTPEMLDKIDKEAEKLGPNAEGIAKVKDNILDIVGFATPEDEEAKKNLVDNLYNEYVANSVYVKTLQEALDKYKQKLAENKKKVGEEANSLTLPIGSSTTGTNGSAIAAYARANNDINPEESALISTMDEVGAEMRSLGLDEEQAADYALAIMEGIMDYEVQKAKPSGRLQNIFLGGLKDNFLVGALYAATQNRMQKGINEMAMRAYYADRESHGGWSTFLDYMEDIGKGTFTFMSEMPILYTPIGRGAGWVTGKALQGMEKASIHLLRRNAVNAVSDKVFAVLAKSGLTNTAKRGVANTIAERIMQTSLSNSAWKRFLGAGLNGSLTFGTADFVKKPFERFAQSATLDRLKSDTNPTGNISLYAIEQATLGNTLSPEALNALYDEVPGLLSGDAFVSYTKAFGWGALSGTAMALKVPFQSLAYGNKMRIPLFGKSIHFGGATKASMEFAGFALAEVPAMTMVGMCESFTGDEWAEYLTQEANIEISKMNAERAADGLEPLTAEEMEQVRNKYAKGTERASQIWWQNFWQNYRATFGQLGAFHIKGVSNFFGTRRYTNEEILHSLNLKREQRKKEGKPAMTAKQEASFIAKMEKMRKFSPLDIMNNIHSNVRELSRRGAVEDRLKMTAYDKQMLQSDAYLREVAVNLTKVSKDSKEGTHSGNERRHTYNTEQLQKALSEVISSSAYPQKLKQKLMYLTVGKEFPVNPVDSVETKEENGKFVVRAYDAKGGLVDEQAFSSQKEADTFGGEYTRQAEDNRIEGDVAAIYNSILFANGGRVMKQMLNDDIDAVIAQMPSELLEQLGLSSVSLEGTTGVVRAEAVRQQDASRTAFVNMNDATLRSHLIPLVGEEAAELLIAKKNVLGRLGTLRSIDPTKKAEDLTDSERETLMYYNTALGSYMENNPVWDNVKEKVADRLGISKEQIDYALEGHDYETAITFSSDLVSRGNGMWRTAKEQNVVDTLKQVLREITGKEEATDNYDDVISKSMPTAEPEAENPHREELKNEALIALADPSKSSPLIHQSRVELEEALTVLREAGVDLSDSNNVAALLFDDNASPEVVKAAETALRVMEEQQGVTDAISDEAEKKMQEKRTYLDSVENRDADGKPTGQIITAVISYGSNPRDGKQKVIVVSKDPRKDKYVKVVHMDTGKEELKLAKGLREITVTSKEAELNSYHAELMRVYSERLEALGKGGAIMQGEEILGDDGSIHRVVGQAMDEKTGQPIPDHYEVETNDGKTMQLSADSIYHMRDNKARTEITERRAKEAEALKVEEPVEEPKAEGEATPEETPETETPQPEEPASVRDKEGRLTAIPTGEDGNTDFSQIELTDAPQMYDLLLGREGGDGSEVNQHTQTASYIKTQLAQVEKDIQSIMTENVASSNDAEMAKKKAEQRDALLRLKKQRGILRLMLDEAGKRQMQDPSFKGIVEGVHSQIFEQASPEWYNYMNDLAKKIGLKVEFANNKDIENYNGKYQNGVVVVNSDASVIDITPEKIRSTVENYFTAVMGHEMTHSFFDKNVHGEEDVKTFKADLIALTKEFLGDKYDKIRAKKLNEKNGEGKAIYTEDDVDEEIVCDMAGQMLSDLNFVRRLLEPSKTTADNSLKEKLGKLDRFKDAIQNIWDKIRSYSYGMPDMDEENSENEALTALQTRYEEVFKNISDKAMKAHASGTITEKEAEKDMERDVANEKASLRTEPAPKRRKYGYKAFKLGKDGNLYPPMVANENGEPTELGVHLDADAGAFKGQSKTGRGKVAQRGGGTLSFRPGWHLGYQPLGKQFLTKEETPRRQGNIVYALVEFDATNDYSLECDAFGMNKNGNYEHAKAGLPYLFKNGYYEYRTNPDPTTDAWAISSSMRVLKLLNRAEENEILTRNGEQLTDYRDDILTDDIAEAINERIHENLRSTSGTEEYLKVCDSIDEAMKKTFNELHDYVYEDSESTFEGAKTYPETDHIFKVRSLDDGRRLLKYANDIAKGGESLEAVKNVVAEAKQRAWEEKQKREGKMSARVEEKEPVRGKDLKVLAKTNLPELAEHIDVTEPDPEYQDVTATRNGEVVASVDEQSNQAMFSVRTFDEPGGGRAIFHEFIDRRVASGEVSKKLGDIMKKEMERLYNECKAIADSGEFKPFSEWSYLEVDKDGEGNPVFSVIKANGDYAMNLDFSLLCKKRRPLDSVLVEMVNRGLIDKMNVNLEGLAYINDIIRAYGFETACRLCFVDARRFRTHQVAKTFCDMWNGMVRAMVPKNSDEYVGIEWFDFLGRGSTQPTGKTLTSLPKELDAETLKEVERVRDTNLNSEGKKPGKKSVAYKIYKHLLEHPEDRKLLNTGDFMDSKDFDAVEKANPTIMTLYNAKEGTGGPKASHGDVQYLGDTAKKMMNAQKGKNWSREKAYEVGGVRIQSFSDYVPHLVFDYIQMLGDLAVGKMPAHAYTKEELFVRQFGLTGLKINMSLVPMAYEKEWIDSGRLIRTQVGTRTSGEPIYEYKWADGSEYHAGLDEKGNYLWQTGETFDYDDAVRIQNAEGYRDNCGTIAVGISDAHIRKMLADPNVRMVIPYHRSGLPAGVAVHNAIDAFVDYSDEQTTKFPSGKASTTAMKDLNNTEKKLKKNYPEFNVLLRKYKDADKAAEEYLKWCSENDCTPKFHRFLEKEVWTDKDGKEHTKWKNTEGYYKMLEDFTCVVPGKDGKMEYKEQGEVKFRFPTAEEARRINEAGGYTDGKFGSMSDLIRRGLAEDADLETRKEENVGHIVDTIESAMLGEKEGVPRMEPGESFNDYVARMKQYHDMESAKMSVRKPLSMEEQEGLGMTEEELIEQYGAVETPEGIKFKEDGDSKYSIRVFHGSAADFEKFDHAFVKSGVGDMVYGFGTYVSSNEETARSFAEISRNNNIKVTTYYRGKAVEDGTPESLIAGLADFGTSFIKETIDNIVSDPEKWLKEPSEEVVSNWKKAQEIVNADDFNRADFSSRINERHIYRVDIPDDNGINYISWEEMPSRYQLRRVGEHISNEDICTILKDLYWDAEESGSKDSFYHIVNDSLRKKIDAGTAVFDEGQKGVFFEEWFKDSRNGKSGQDLYNSIEQFCHDKEDGREDKAMSKFLSDAGFTGVKVPIAYTRGGTKEGGLNYVIFKEDDAKIVNHEKFSHRKEEQLDIILKNNPADDSLGAHTWIRSVEDIKTFAEANEDFAGTPDYTEKDMREAMRKGSIKVYSSYPIKDGTFVTPSLMEAQNYAGGGKVYDKEIRVEDIAWLDSLQGQVAQARPNDWQALTEEEKTEIANKVVGNVVIPTSKIPSSRAEAKKMVSSMTQPFYNVDQGIDIYVSNSDVKHSSGFRAKEQYEQFGAVDEMIKNAVKISEEADRDYDNADVKSVSIYYCPVNIGGKQYSARMVVKEYAKGSFVLDEMHLYNSQLRKEKGSVAQSTFSNDTPAHPTEPLSGYKVSDLIHNTQENDKKILGISEKITKFSVRSGSYFSGGGLVEDAMRGLMDGKFGVEFDSDIAAVFKDNHGSHIINADVRDPKVKEQIRKQLGGKTLEYFHASPVCKNYSKAKRDGEESELDIETAKATADFINEFQPNVVTIENAASYGKSEAVKHIIEALQKNGYAVDAEVYNAKDFGGYINRERLIVRAAKDGNIPMVAEHAKSKGWYEAVKDLIPTLKKGALAPWQAERLKAEGIDVENVGEPMIVYGGAMSKGTTLHAYASEVAPSINTKEGGSRIIMPNGDVLMCTPRVFARLMGLSDDYKLPKSDTLAYKIIGNGVPAQLTKGVIEPLVKAHDTEGGDDPNGGGKYSFRGEAGASRLDSADGGTRMEDLKVAEEMEKANKDALSIKRATGWERGADGKWRHEGVGLKWKEDAFSKRWGKNVKLSDLVEDNELFKAYPELDEVNIRRINSRTTAGQYNPSTNTLEINADSPDYSGIIKMKSEMRDSYSRMGNDKMAKKMQDEINDYEKWEEESRKDAIDTLNHEVQHIIQHIEGFATGGSWNPKWSEELAKLDPMERAMINAFSSNLPKLPKAGYNHIKGLIERGLQNDSLGEDYRNQLELLRDNLTPDNLADYAKKAEANRKRIIKEAKERYPKLAGEVEARNAGRRAFLSEEDIRNTLGSETEEPEYPREEQVVKFSSRLRQRNGESDDDFRQREADYLASRAMAENKDEARSIVIDGIKSMLDNKLVDNMGKARLNRILRAVNNADEGNIIATLKEAQSLVRDIRTQIAAKEMYDLLNLKAQDVNGKNMNIAKAVDNNTRMVLDSIKKRIKGIVDTDEDKQMRQLRHHNFELRRDKEAILSQLSRGGLTPEDQADLEQSILDIDAKIAENNTKVNDLWNQRRANVIAEVGNTLEGIDADIAEMMQKMADAADLDSPVKWTYEDARKLVEAEILRKRLDILKTDNELFKQRKERAQAGRAEMRRAYDSLIEDLEIQRSEKVNALLEQVRDLVSTGKNNLVMAKMAEVQHKVDLIRGMFRDIRGKNRSQRESEERGAEDWWKRVSTAPLGSFEYMAHRIDRNHLSHDGWFYKTFVTGKEGVMAAQNAYITAHKKSMTELKDATERILGKSIDKIANEQSEETMEHGVTLVRIDEDDMGRPVATERIPFTTDTYNETPEALSKAQATYLWMVWQMNDGKAKMEAMGFDETSMGEIRKFIGEKNVKWASYVQDKFLPSIFERTQARYLEMYGTPMADIENYVPIRLAAAGIGEKADLSGDKKTESGMEIKSGFMINRTANLKAIDTTQNAFNLIAEHVNDAEEFIAFARVRRDLETILSSAAVKKQLNDNVKGQFRALQDAAMIAVRASKNQSTKGIDDAFGKISKGLIGANIAFRNTTALKQMLSVPAFLGYSQDPRFIAAWFANTVGQYGGNALAIASNMATFGFANKYLLKGIEDGKTRTALTDTIRWCAENVPSYFDRVMKGNMGIDVLEQEMGDGKIAKFVDAVLNQGMTSNKLVDAVTCAIGIKTIYDYKMAREHERINRSGLTGEAKAQALEEAKRMALMEADIYYNGTQQSNHVAFMSPMQLDKSALSRMLSVYQNASVGFARKAAESFQNLSKVANAEKLIRTYTNDYIADGMDEAEANKLAKKRVFNQLRKSAVSLLLYGLGMNLLWDMGSHGFIGTMLTEDDWKDLVDIPSLISYPMRGMPATNFASSVFSTTWSLAHGEQAGSFGYNPLLIFGAIEDMFKTVGKDLKDYGWGKELAMDVLSKSGKIVGINPEIITNTYLALEDIIAKGIIKREDARLMTDLMLFLQTPNSNRKAVAKQVFGITDGSVWDGILRVMGMNDNKIPENLTDAEKAEYEEKFMQYLTYAYKYFDSDDYWHNWTAGSKVPSEKQLKSILKEIQALEVKDDVVEKGFHQITETEMKERIKNLKTIDELKAEYNDPENRNATYKAKLKTAIKALEKDKDFKDMNLSSQIWAVVGGQYSEATEPKTRNTDRTFEALADYDTMSKSEKFNKEFGTLNKRIDAGEYTNEQYSRWSDMYQAKSEIDFLKYDLKDKDIPLERKREIMKQIAEIYKGILK